MGIFYLYWKKILFFDSRLFLLFQKFYATIFLCYFLNFITSLFQSKQIFIQISEFNYIPGQEITGHIHFDFGEEMVKASGITLSLFRKKHGYTTNNGQHDFVENISSVTLAPNGEYSKWDFPFRLIIPANAITTTKQSFSAKLVEQVPVQFRSLAQIGANIFFGSSQKLEKESFYLEARMDIPWGVDITEKIVIGITAQEVVKELPTI